MKLRVNGVILILSAACLCLAPQAFAAPKTTKAQPAKESRGSRGTGENRDAQFRLKPGAKLKACLTCHADFEEKLKKQFVHTPVTKTGCSACHNPHTSNYPKQLSATASALCLTCHADILPAGARSTHKVALEGKCVDCHDPHSADNKFNLKTGGNDLCYGCHKDKAESISKVRFKHSPVTKGCVSCHSPHSSTKAGSLLKSAVPELCKECHAVDKPFFIKQHANYPVGGSQCTNCHNAHGSDKAGIVYNTTHPPFVNKTCNLCHEASSSPKPLALKKKGFELCRGCHNNIVNQMFSKNRLHSPVVGKEGCLNCHSPHASPEKGLLKNTPIKVCGTCHEDTIQRQERSITKHQPIKDGMCTTCHSPHASDNEFLFNQATTIELCGTCHDWQKHSTHPIGEKVIDKRNKNLTLQCLSCHRSHGTEYKRMMPFATVTELCTQCHVEYRR
jgi:DmsE family decaheme c-type cytochrome